MKKKLLTAAAICAAAAIIAACSSWNNQNEAETAIAAETSAVMEETSAAGVNVTGAGTDRAGAEGGTKGAPVKPDLSAVDPMEAMGPGAFDVDEDSEEMKNFKELVNSDYQEFAGQIIEAFENKDMEALAEIMHYPSYVSCMEENGGIVKDKETFLRLDRDKIFDDALTAVLKDADLEELDPLMAGVVIGDGTPSVTFHIRDGKLGITGINY